MESKKNCEGFNEALRPYEERIRQLEEENRRLKVENARQRRKQRKKEISQKRREAASKRWSKESANVEASTPAESYKAANAVSVQSQNIVQGSARKTLRKTYRPTHAQVAAYMQNRLGVRENVAEFEAAKFRDHYDALNWEIKGTPIVDWEACARNWVRRAAEYNGRGIFEEQERTKEKPVTEAERQKIEEKGNNGLVATIAERICAGDYSETTGATAWEVKEMIDKGIYTDDWKGELARKVCGFIKTEAASTPTESYSVVNAETGLQVVIPYTAQDTARKTYRPTETQVCEYMQGVLHLPKYVAEEEARKFFDYYSASGWTMRGAPIADWEACVRNWVNHINLSEQEQARLENERVLAEVKRRFEERERYKREHGEEDLPY